MKQEMEHEMEDSPHHSGGSEPASPFAAVVTDDDDDMIASPMAQTFLSPAQVQNLVNDVAHVFKELSEQASNVVGELVRKVLQHASKEDRRSTPRSAWALPTFDCNVDSFVDMCPALTDGDFISLQQPTFDAVQDLLQTHVVVSRDALEQLLRWGEHVVSRNPSPRGGEAAEEGQTAVVAEVPSATNTGRKEAKQVRRLSSASCDRGDAGPQHQEPAAACNIETAAVAPSRRNLAIAGVVASTKAKSLFRPQSGGSLSGANSSLPLLGPAPSPSDNVSLHPPAADTAVPQLSVAALPPRSSSPTPHLMPPEDLAAQVFRDVDRHIKDERGQNRFASTEYSMEATIDSNTTVDRRLKPGVMHRPKDEAMLHNLEPSRREFMIQYFGDVKVRERRQKEILAEELLRQNRQAHRTVSPALGSSSHGGRPPTATSSCGHHKSGLAKADESDAMPASPDAPSRQRRAGSATVSKRWESAADELDVWNPVRTRPASAASNLPVEYATTATSIVAAKFLQQSHHTVERPQSSSQREEGLSFAEMVARRRDQLLAEARQSTRKESSGEPSALEESGVAAAAVDRGAPMSSEDAAKLISIIDPSEGLYRNRSKLVRVVPTNRATTSQQKVNGSASPLTTIVTAAYLLPSAGSGRSSKGTAPRSPSPPGASQSASKMRRKFNNMRQGQKVNDLDKSAAAARCDDDCSAIQSGWSPERVPIERSPNRGRVITTGTSSGAASVASAAAVRVQKSQPGRTSP